jgi:uncharacterized membrane protein
MSNWHQEHKDKLSFGDRISDAVANRMGSWTFIIAQTIIVVIWMALNAIGIVAQWDAYPFILLNLLFSTQAAYAAPIIMMAQNRAGERDRLNAQHDYDVNLANREEIRLLHEILLAQDATLKEIRAHLIDP